MEVDSIRLQDTSGAILPAGSLGADSALEPVVHNGVKTGGKKLAFQSDVAGYGTTTVTSAEFNTGGVPTVVAEMLRVTLPFDKLSSNTLLAMKAKVIFDVMSSNPPLTKPDLATNVVMLSIRFAHEPFNAGVSGAIIQLDNYDLSEFEINGAFYIDTTNDPERKINLGSGGRLQFIEKGFNDLGSVTLTDLQNATRVFAANSTTSLEASPELVFELVSFASIDLHPAICSVGVDINFEQ
jgi:hypothetical protein